MRLVVHCIDWRPVPSTAAKQLPAEDGCATGGSPAPPGTCSLYCRAFPGLPITADWHVLIAKLMESVGREHGWKSREKIAVNQPGKRSPYSYWPSLLLHSKSRSQSRSTCRSESSFILLSFWNLILVVFHLGVGKEYGSIVCAWICTLDLSTPSCQLIDTIHS